MEKDKWILQNPYIKIVIVALVSAGKSTLVNALIGKDLFPMTSSSCTAKIIALHAQNKGKKSGAKWRFEDHIYGSARNVDKSLLHRFNTDTRDGELIYNGSLFGMEQNLPPYLIIDTPGINDAFASYRSEVTIRLLKQIKEGLVIYVGSVKHVGTSDEERFFQNLSLLMKEHTKLKWMIALNRADTLNRSSEGITDFMDVEYRLAERCGLERPDIYPISALGALLCRRVLMLESLTEDEFDEFDRVMRYFRRELQGGDEGEPYDIELYDEGYHSKQVNQVCSCTGILELERAIRNYIEEKHKLNKQR